MDSRITAQKARILCGLDKEPERGAIDEILFNLEIGAKNGNHNYDPYFQGGMTDADMDGVVEQLKGLGFKARRMGEHLYINWLC